MPKKRGMDALDERAAELADGIKPRVSARAERPEPEEPEERDTTEPRPVAGSVEVDLEDDDDDDDDAPEERAPRRERRAERGRIFHENAELKERIARLEGAAARPAPQYAPPAPVQQQEDPYERELNNVVMEAEQLEARGRTLSSRKDAAGNIVGMTPEETAQMRKDWMKLEQRKTDIMVHRAGGGRAQQQQDPIQAMLAAEFADVFAGGSAQQPSQAIKWAQARWQLRLAEGAPNNLDTARAALNEARSRFKTAPSAARVPTAATKAKFAGVSRGGGGADAGDAPRKVVLTAKQQEMAESRFPRLPTKEAYKRFAKEIVSKQRAARERA